MDEALDDPQMRHLAMDCVLEHPTEGAVRTLRSPIFLDGERDDAAMTAPPSLDEHGDSIRAALKRPPRKT